MTRALADWRHSRALIRAGRAARRRHLRERRALAERIFQDGLPEVTVTRTKDPVVDGVQFVRIDIAYEGIIRGRGDENDGFYSDGGTYAITQAYDVATEAEQADVD